MGIECVVVVLVLALVLVLDLVLDLVLVVVFVRYLVLVIVLVSIIFRADQNIGWFCSRVSSFRKEDSHGSIDIRRLKIALELGFPCRFACSYEAIYVRSVRHHPGNASKLIILYKHMKDLDRFDGLGICQVVMLP